MSWNVFEGWLPQAVGGPGHLRFIIQPAVAILLGLRDGRLDARAGRSPYLWGLLFEPGRKGRLLAALRGASVPLAVAIIVDSCLQLYTLRTLHIRWSLTVGILIVGLPYCLARALGNRATRFLRRHRASGGPVEQAP